MRTKDHILSPEGQLSILIVDDEIAIGEGLVEFLNPLGFNVKTTSRANYAFELMEVDQFDIVILDLLMPEIDGLSALKLIKSKYPETDVIMISGFGDMQNVIDAMRLGAIDFFQKPFRVQDIQRAIENTMRYRKLKNELQEANTKYHYLSQDLQLRHGKQIIGESAPMKKIFHLIKRVAETDTTSVLITGESGTGKELIARAIHLLSDRKDKLFLAVNCSSISETLFESEFFGHAKGSYTGAIDNRQGYFEAAHKGTLFLDEIGDLPLPLQAKLLRALEERKITKLG
ncbi:MAG: sigma-54 dependent transcriptional regulator, partial [Bacteroidota bacterium]